MIEQVLDRHHERGIESLARLEGLRDGEVVDGEAGAFERERRGVTVVAGCGHGKRRGVKPMLQGALVGGQIAVGDAVGPSADGVGIRRNPTPEKLGVKNWPVSRMETQ